MLHQDFRTFYIISIQIWGTGVNYRIPPFLSQDNFYICAALNRPLRKRLLQRKGIYGI